jgi:uncharacterized lipoprotein
MRLNIGSAYGREQGSYYSRQATVRNMKLEICVISLLLSFCVGCTSPTLIVNYTPGSTMTVEGTMNVGEFRYIPGEDEKLQPNQIRNTAAGTPTFDKPIDEIIETAVFTEARFVGIELGDSAHLLTGEIIEFLLDDLGFSMEWTLEIRYLIAGCYDRTQTVKKRDEKFMRTLAKFYLVIRQNIELLFADTDFRRCIDLQ